MGDQDGMAEDLLGYGEMVDQAMRMVVRFALNKVAKEGLPGDHHFYITFRTDHPDVVMPDYLKERYFPEMLIVLQNKFYDLQAHETGFAVTLSFNRKHETLSIPYAALVKFADPAVNFGLQFHHEFDYDHDNDSDDDSLIDPTGSDSTETSAILPETADITRPTKQTRGKEKKSAAAEESADDASSAQANGAAVGGDNVVTLDKFRKR